MNIDKHPIHKAIYELCLEIENLPASDQQTKIVTMAGNLHQPVDKLVDGLEEIVRDFDKLNGNECTEGCGKCIRCLAVAALAV